MLLQGCSCVVVQCCIFRTFSCLHIHLSLSVTHAWKGGTAASPKSMERCECPWKWLLGGNSWGNRAISALMPCVSAPSCYIRQLVARTRPWLLASCTFCCTLKQKPASKAALASAAASYFSDQMSYLCFSPSSHMHTLHSFCSCHIICSSIFIPSMQTCCGLQSTAV